MWGDLVAASVPPDNQGVFGLSHHLYWASPSSLLSIPGRPLLKLCSRWNSVAFLDKGGSFLVRGPHSFAPRHSRAYGRTSSTETPLITPPWKWLPLPLQTPSRFLDLPSWGASCFSVLFLLLPAFLWAEFMLGGTSVPKEGPLF